MQSIKVPKYIKVFLAMLIIMSSLLGSLGPSAFAAEDNEKIYEGDQTSFSQAKPKNPSLMGGHTYSDIYASIIFSKASGGSGKGSASSAKISYDELVQYPTADGITDDARKSENNAIYGNLSSPTSTESAKKAGVQFANIIKTLYYYDWLVPAPKDSEKDGPTSTFWKAIVKQDDQSKTKLTMNTLLTTASQGAAVYDTFDWLIDKFEDVSIALNIPQLFKAATGHDENGDSHFTNFINDAITKTLNSMGLDSDAIQVLQYIMYGIIIFMFVLTLIWAMRNKNAKTNSINVLKRRAIPILVIIMTIPISIMGKNVVDEMADSFDKATSSNPNQFNSHYVVDTLQWAATTNLNIGLINPNGNLNNNTDKNTEKMTSYAPTPSRVNNLMSKVNSNAMAAGMGDKDLTAKKLISEIANQKVIDVNSYLAAISTSEKGNPAIAASEVPLFKGETISRGTYGASSKDYAQDALALIESSAKGKDSVKGGSKVKEGLTSTESYEVKPDAKDPMFFFPNDADSKKQEQFKNAIKDNMTGQKLNKDKIKGNKDISNDYQFRSADGRSVGSQAQAIRLSAERDNHYPIKWVRVTDHVMPFAENSPYSYINLKQQDPAGYIYGAGLAGNANKSSTRVENYVDGATNNQKVNFVTGEDYGKANKEDADKKEDDSKDKNDKDAPVAKPYDFEEDARINSLRIALMNRYAGVTTTSGSNVQSLSTQSVTFLLQTVQNGNKGIYYEGQNAIPSDEGAKKNSGKNGNGFVRYTIPNTGYFDLVGKAGSINAVWVTSAVIAAIAFLYLLRAPIFGSIIKMFKSYLAALFTGSLAGLLTYITFYAVIRASFMFAKAAIVLGSTIAISIVDGMGMLKGAFATSSLVSASSMSVIGFVIVLSLALCWPVTELNIGGKQKKTSIIGIVILLPYIIGEALEESFNRLEANVTGKRSGSGMLSGRVRKLSARESISTAGSNAAKAGAGVATAATGFAGLAGGVSTAMLRGGKLASVGKNMLGRFATMPGGSGESNSYATTNLAKDGINNETNKNQSDLDRLQSGQFKDANKENQNNQNDVNLNENQTENQTENQNQSANPTNLGRDDRSSTKEVGTNETDPNNVVQNAYNDNNESENNDNIQQNDQNDQNDAKDGEDGKNGVLASSSTKGQPSAETDGGENGIGTKATENSDEENSNEEQQFDENGKPIVAVAKNGTKGEPEITKDGGSNENIEQQVINNNGDVNNENVENINTDGDNHTNAETVNNEGSNDTNAKDDNNASDDNLTNVKVDNDGQEEEVKDQKVENQQLEQASIAKSQQGSSEVKDANVVTERAQEQDVDNSRTENDQAEQASIAKSQQGSSEVKDANVVTEKAQNQDVDNANTNNSKSEQMAISKSQEGTTEAKDQNGQTIDQKVGNQTVESQNAKGQNIDKQDTKDQTVDKQDANSQDVNNVRQDQAQTNRATTRDASTQNAKSDNVNNKAVSSNKDNMTNRQINAVQNKERLEKVIEHNNNIIKEKTERVNNIQEKVKNGTASTKDKNDLAKLQRSIEKAQNNNNIARSRIASTEKIIQKETRTDRIKETVNNMKESNVYNNSKQIVQGAGQVAGAGKDFIQGQRSDRPKARNNSNDLNRSNRESSSNPLADRREREANKRANDLQEEQIREIKKLNQQMRNNSYHK